MVLKLVTVSIFFGLVTIFVSLSNAQLSANFYAKTCPKLETIVLNTMKQAVSKEPRMGASILRLHFHDCFVNGCDGSILLDSTSTLTGEKGAFANRNGSARGFEVIDAIKTTNVEASCDATVSCADILTLAARDGIVLLGGPSWNVPLGRRDSRTASLSTANANLPPPTSDLSNLTVLFSLQGLSTKEMTTLSGAHTIGQARCTNFRAHIYNDANINPSFATTRKSNCPQTAGNGDNNLAPLDLQTSTKFDNNYYINLVAKKGLLHSDQQLFNGGSQDAQVRSYSNNAAVFISDFVAAMIKMGNIGVLTGTKGEIRKNCRLIN